MSKSRDNSAFIAANRDLWNAWTPHHVTGEFYDVEGFLAGREVLDEVETGCVGDVGGKKLLHLQCHFGMDTLGWARRGASVTGVDFSHEAITQARALAKRAGIEARFVECDVYDTLHNVEPGTFDIVFTSYGAISWLPDLGPWAEVIAGALKPGGVFEIVEHHPYLWPFDESITDHELVWKYRYFGGEVLREDNIGSYGAPDSGVEAASFSWQHTFSDQIGALLGAGLRITSLTEYPFISFPWFPYNVKGEDGFWHMPDDMPELPMMYRITATKDV